jgi:hypothetical protein
MKEVIVMFKSLDSIPVLGWRDAHTLADEIIDVVIAVLQHEPSISPPRSFIEWSLVLANPRARVAELIAGKTKGFADLESVRNSLQTEWPDEYA